MHEDHIKRQKHHPYLHRRF